MDGEIGFTEGHPELISVIVPVYQVSGFLDKCVESILEQTSTNLEIILVEDGSPDNCGAMCDAWAAKDSRIKAVHKKNGGPSAARNVGLEMATGSLISFVDGDDLIKPDFLETLLEAMEEHDAQVAECAVELVGENGNTIGHWKTAKMPVMDNIEALRRMILEEGIFSTVWNKLYRRQVLEGILFEEGKYHEDEFWTYQVFDRMERLAAVDRPLYCYRKRIGSIMNCGYNLKRLDGPEARMIRLADLSKYEQLKYLLRQQLMLDHLWHMQRIFRFLQGQERKQALETIMNMKKATPRVPLRKLTLSKIFTFWYIMFVTAPKLTAKLRNFLKIDY